MSDGSGDGSGWFRHGADVLAWGVLAQYMQGLLMVLGMVQDGSDKVQTAQFLCLEMGGS